ncbi:ATP-binding cassette domain-containing protein, partial [Kibdelosporangium lantanae]
MTAMLEVSELRHSYGTFTAVQDLNFTVGTGELACIVGPSGCGKSTLLRCIAGLIKPSAGQVSLHGDLIERTPSDLAVVFQDYSRSLFPWLSVPPNEFRDAATSWTTHFGVPSLAHSWSVSDPNFSFGSHD